MTTLPAVVRIVDLPTGTTITGAELFEVVQTASGVGLSVQVPISAIMTTTLGALPTGGGTSQILAKSSGSNFSTAWYDLTTFVSVDTTTGLGTSGSGTALVIGIATGGISSAQLANNAVGTNQLASSLGIASSLSVGTLLTVGGTATFNGTAIFNATAIYSNGLQVTGTSLLTGTFGVVGTAQFTGAFNIAGTTLVTGNLGVVGTTLATGSFGIVGTTLVTGTFGQVGTANFTSNAFNVVGTTIFTSGAFGIVGTTIITGSFGIQGTATFTSFAFNVLVNNFINLNGTTNLTGSFNQVGTSLMTGRFGVSGTANFTGAFNVVGTATVTGSLNLGSYTAGILVSNSTGVISNQGGMVLLNTLSPNGVASTNDTTSFSATYRNYMITFEAVTPATNTTVFQMQVATTGSAFISANYTSAVASVATGLSNGTTSNYALSLNNSTGAVGTSAYGLNGSIILYGAPSSVNKKFITGLVIYQAANGTSFQNLSAYGTYDATTSPITGVNFLFSSGNIATGIIKIFGMT